MGFVEIFHEKSGKVLKIYEFWLRDHCRCNHCYNEITKQRKVNLLNIPADIKCAEMEYDEDGGKCHVKWSDGHLSTYDINFLHQSQLDQRVHCAENNSLRTPWNQAIILQNERHLHISLADLVVSDAKVKEVLKCLIRYGIVFIDDVPATQTMTEMAVRRLFPVMRTLYGEMYTFSDAQLTHADTAYTKQFIDLHNDNTYFCDAAGLQALHCIKHENGTGGENFFVDGLHAVLELKRRYPQAYDVLSTVQVPAEYIEEGQYHTHTAPIIRLDPLTGEFQQLRFNFYDRAIFDTIPQDEMPEFYASFRQFLDIIQSMDNRLTLKLEPGTTVIYDNWRLCHARHAYTGERTMTGCYVQRTDFLSKARVEGIID